jgi:hypothetical protein
VIEFHQRAAGGFKSGEQWKVVGRQGASELVLERDGKKRFFSLSRPGSFNVFEPESIPLSVGDRVRITKNFKSQGKQFRNNELHTVTSIEDGKITLDGAEIISRGGLHIDQGFVITSHAAQGKTVDQVIVSVPIDSFSQTKRSFTFQCREAGRRCIFLPIQRLR